MPTMTIKNKIVNAATNPVAAIAVPVDREFSDASVLPAILKLELVSELSVTFSSISSGSRVVTWTDLTNSISLIDEVCAGAIVVFNGSATIGSSVGSLLIEKTK